MINLYFAHTSEQLDQQAQTLLQHDQFPAVLQIAQTECGTDQSKLHDTLIRIFEQAINQGLSSKILNFEQNHWAALPNTVREFTLELLCHSDQASGALGLLKQYWGQFSLVTYGEMIQGLCEQNLRFEAIQFALEHFDPTLGYPDAIPLVQVLRDNQDLLSRQDPALLLTTLKQFPNDLGDIITEALLERSCQRHHQRLRKPYEAAPLATWQVESMPYWHPLQEYLASSYLQDVDLPYASITLVGHSLWQHCPWVGAGIDDMLCDVLSFTPETTEGATNPSRQYQQEYAQYCETCITCGSTALSFENWMSENHPEVQSSDMSSSSSSSSSSSTS